MKDFVNEGNRHEFYDFLSDVIEEYIGDDPYGQNLKSLTNWALRLKFNKRDRDRKEAISELVDTIDMAFQDENSRDAISTFKEWQHNYTSVEGSWFAEDMFDILADEAYRAGWNLM